MKTSKSVKDIIGVQNSCKEIIEELYSYDSRPNDVIRENYRSSKLNEAIRLEIIDYDEYEDILSLSSDTEEYYKTRLGQNDDTNVAIIGLTLEKLKQLLKNYNLRIESHESGEREVKAVAKLLSKIPSLLRYNLQAITSTSLFAFKNEPNYEIKMLTLNSCNDDITALIKASKKVDRFLVNNRKFLKSMSSMSINSAVMRVKKNSVSLEGAFRSLFEDIKNFINQSIQDGVFIEKLKKLKVLKDENRLLRDSNLEELLQSKRTIVEGVKEKRLHPDDQLFDYMPTIMQIISERKVDIADTRKSADISFDLEAEVSVKKRLYDYPKLHKTFLIQEQDLFTFLQEHKIESSRILGVFVRMLKNYASHYDVEDGAFIEFEGRMYAKVFSKKSSRRMITE